MRGSKKDRFRCSGVRFQDGLDSGIQVSVNRCRIPDSRPQILDASLDF
jgi:hypothetical protein